MPAWEDRAACVGSDPGVWFDVAREADALAVCGRCQVRADCLETALRAEHDEGVWGGLTAERRAELVAIVNDAPDP